MFCQVFVFWRFFSVSVCECDEEGSLNLKSGGVCMWRLMGGDDDDDDDACVVWLVDDDGTASPRCCVASCGVALRSSM